MREIQNVKNLKGKKVLVRVDFNVPIKGKTIRDSFRIDTALKTVKFLKNKGAIQILISHIGSDGVGTLLPVFKYLSKKIKIYFIKDKIGSDFLNKKINGLKPGDIVLLENIRKYKGEEENDKNFSKELSKLGDIFVNDAFSVSHRKHASTIGVINYLPSYVGFQFQDEVEALGSVLKDTKNPFIFILGGAKFSTKMPIIERFIKQADKVVVCGALLNNFYKVSGFETGRSVVEDGYEKEIKKYLSNPKILLPIDVVVLRDGKSFTVSPNEVLKEDIIVDIGNQTMSLLDSVLKKAKTIVWNGPLGWYERGFVKATVDLGKIILKSKAKVIVGGGDTVTVLGNAFSKKKNIFVSTGGGATIEYLAKGTTEGVKLMQ